MRRNVLSATALLVLLLCSAVFAQPPAPSDLSQAVSELRATVDATVFRLNIIMLVAGFLATAAGLLLAAYGYYNIHRAEKIVNTKVQEELEKFRKQLPEEFARVGETTQKMIAAYSLQSSGKIDQAIELYKEAVRIMPNAFNAYASLGYAYLQKENAAEALLAFDRAAKYFPDRVASYNDLARVYALLGNKEKTSENIKAMAKIDKGSIKFLMDDPVILKILSKEDIQNLYHT